jgi:hypothetical protein
VGWGSRASASKMEGYQAWTRPSGGRSAAEKLCAGSIVPRPGQPWQSIAPVWLVSLGGRKSSKPTVALDRRFGGVFPALDDGLLCLELDPTTLSIVWMVKDHSSKEPMAQEQP